MITQRQREVLACCMRSWLKCGMFPTYREVVRLFDFSGTNAVDCHLRALQRKGYIKRIGYARRYNWQPTEKARECLIKTMELKGGMLVRGDDLVFEVQPKWRSHGSSD